MNKMIFLTVLIMVIANPVSAEAKKSSKGKYQMKAYSGDSESLRRNKLEEVKADRAVASEEVSEEKSESDEESAREIASMKPMVDGDDSVDSAKRNIEIKEEEKRDTRRGMKTIHIERTFLQSDRQKY